MPYFPRTLNPGPDEGSPDYRMSLLPFGTYPNSDGSGEHLGFAVPGMISEPVNALARLMGSPSHPGTFTQGPDAGSNAEDMRTLLETFIGGATTRGMGSAAMAMADHAPSLPGAVLASAENAPLRAYHGTMADVPNRFEPSQSGTFGPGFYAAYDDPNGYGSGAEFAGQFARTHAGGNAGSVSPNYETGSKIFPLDVTGRFATGDQFRDAVRSAPGATDAEKMAAAVNALRSQGFDGAAQLGELGLWNRGTVTSPLTGETLYSDGLPSLWSSSLQPQQDQRYPNALFTY